MARVAPAAQSALALVVVVVEARVALAAPADLAAQAVPSQTSICCWSA
ncbi:MAG: hypothetical protein MH112_12175 [Phenylobacterium sp.]|nr:hypothetical protein [Phenylobacterium sp.]MCG9917098.1 hypothetical protein [Phenylobacterium sp.]